MQLVGCSSTHSYFFGLDLTGSVCVCARVCVCVCGVPVRYAVCCLVWYVGRSVLVILEAEMSMAWMFRLISGLTQ